MTREQYDAVSAAMLKRWGITAEDAGWGSEDYELSDGQSPEEFVEWYGEKYDLFDFNEQERLQEAIRAANAQQSRKER